MSDLIARMQAATVAAQQQQVNKQRQAEQRRKKALYEGKNSGGQKRDGFKEVSSQLKMVHAALQGLQPYEDLAVTIGDRYSDVHQQLASAAQNVQDQCQQLDVPVVEGQIALDEQALKNRLDCIAHICRQLKDMFKICNEDIWKEYLRHKIASPSKMVADLNKILVGPGDEKFGKLSSMQYQLTQSTVQDAAGQQERLKQYLADCEDYIHGIDGIDDKEIQDFLQMIIRKEITLSSLTPKVKSWLQRNGLQEHIQISWQSPQ